MRSGPSDDPDHLFLADVRHLGTVGQGLLASLFLATIDAKFDAGVPPLSGREVLEFAATHDKNGAARSTVARHRPRVVSSQKLPAPIREVVYSALATAA